MASLFFYRYKLLESNCYKLLEELATFISSCLKGHFPLVFEQLQKVRNFEGFGEKEASIKDILLTTNVITRDYN
jgi:hypothetical protein